MQMFWFRTALVVETSVFSKSTHQIPYIKYNREEVSDTPMIMHFLCEKMELDPGEGLTFEQRGSRRAIHRMLDESLALTNFLYRYSYHTGEFAKYFQAQSRCVGAIVRYFMKKGMLTRGRFQGMGRHTEEEVMDIAREDIQALADYLGHKKYLMGDQITMIDCVAFGHLSPMVYIDMNFPQKEYILHKVPSVKAYLDRIKETLWPDWHLLVPMGTFND